MFFSHNVKPEVEHRGEAEHRNTFRQFKSRIKLTEKRPTDN